VAEAHGWNAISESPALVNEAERYEVQGIAYKVGYGPDGFGITVTEPERQAGRETKAAGHQACGLTTPEI
jgi:hypothetical protein